MTKWLRHTRKQFISLQKEEEKEDVKIFFSIFRYTTPDENWSWLISSVRFFPKKKGFLNFRSSKFNEQCLIKLTSL